MKKLHVLILSILLLVCISCGNLQDKIDDNNNLYEDDVVELQYWEAEWSKDEEYADAVRLLVEQYNKENQGRVHVNVTMIPWDNYYEYYLESIAAGKGPDVCSSSMTQPTQYAKMGLALDLTSILKEWEDENSIILTDISDESFRYFTYDDTLIGLPFGITFKVIYYREDMLKDAGISTLPENLEDLTRVLKILKSEYPGKIPMLADMSENTALARLSTFFLEVNGGVAVNSDFSPAFNTNNNRNSFSYLSQWSEEGLITDNNPDEEALKSFLAGDGCMVLTSVSPSALYTSDLYPLCGILTNIAGPNTMLGYKTYSPQAYHGFSTTSYPEESKRFLKWMIENDYALFNNGSRGTILPLRTSYMEQLGSQDPKLANAMEEFNHTKRLYSYPFSTLQSFHIALDSSIYANLAEDIINGTDVVEALSKADTAVGKIKNAD